MPSEQNYGCLNEARRASRLVAPGWSVATNGGSKEFHSNYPRGGCPANKISTFVKQSPILTWVKQMRLSRLSYKKRWAFKHEFVCVVLCGCVWGDVVLAKFTANHRVTALPSHPPTRRPTPGNARSWHTTPFPTWNVVKISIPMCLAYMALLHEVRVRSLNAVDCPSVGHILCWEISVRQTRMCTYATSWMGRGIPS